jgi:hypothetical protein
MLYSPRSSLYTILEEGGREEIDNTQVAPPLLASSKLHSTNPTESAAQEKCYLFSRLLTTNAMIILLVLACVTVPPLCRQDVSYSRMLSLRHVSFDAAAKSVQAPKRTLLFDDGTLFMPEDGESMCQYFLHPSRSHTKIKRIHYHFNHCHDDNAGLGRQLSDYFGAFLLANAAQVPFTMTCDPYFYTGELEETILSRLIVDGDSIGPQPIDLHGKKWTPLDVCQACNALPTGCQELGLLSETTRHTMRNLAVTEESASTKADDAVIHLRLGDALAGSDNDHGKSGAPKGLLPHRAYSDAIKQAALEQGEIETITIIIRSPRGSSELIAHRTRIVANDLVQHLQEEFPHAAVQTIKDGDEPTTKTFQRLIKANKISICGVSSLCTHPVLANENGLAFLYKFPNHGNDWATNLSRMYMNVREWEAPLLESNYIATLTDEQLLNWLRTQDPKAEDMDVVMSSSQRQVKVIEG